MWKRFTRPTIVLAALLGFTSLGLAQTGNQPTAKSSPSAPARDVSGIWVAQTGQGPALLSSSNQEPPMTAWGKEQFKTNAASNDPHAKCEAAGVPRADLSTRPIEIVQTPRWIVVFYEEYHDWRKIWTDGRPLPADAGPWFNGYSVGRWDGDTLVVESAGFNDLTWLDNAGHPHSEALHVVERFRRVNPDTLQVNFTIEDPMAYSEPWTSATRIYKRRHGYELKENFCVPEPKVAIARPASRLPAQTE